MAAKPGSLVQLYSLIAFAASSTTNYKLEFSRSCEVGDNDIHALKSICGRLTNKGI